MSQDAHHHELPKQATHSFNVAFAIAVILNFSFVVIEVFYAHTANSMALLADAVHNFGDVFGLLLAWGANWLLRFPARKRYSYGYKRITILASLANALILVATSALIAYEAIYKLLHLTPVNEFIILVVALIGIFINGGTSLLFMRGIHEDLNIKGAFVHLAADALISAGVVFASALIWYTGQYWLDPAFSLIIVFIVLWSTWTLLRDSVVLLLDAIPHYIDHAGIKDYLSHLPGVEAIHDLHIWGLSTREIALTAHLIMPGKKLSDADFVQINTDLKKKFRIDHATLQIEAGSLEFPCEGC
ncbi:MAG TPA: cation diffusion facilitator family transporter [Gammaproteobacteria bacterium]|nr:cation diffusion facilitator family transporter [Gammaproteobacteria bacterium]